MANKKAVAKRVGTGASSDPLRNQTAFWAGTETVVVGRFFKPETKWSRVEVLDVTVRRPYVKQTQGEDIRVLFDLSVRHGGHIMPWEVTSKGLAEQLQRIVQGPCTLWVRQVKRGKFVEYEVASEDPTTSESKATPVDPANNSAGDSAPALCPKNGCVLEQHEGPHMTQAEWTARFGTKPTTLVA